MESKIELFKSKLLKLYKNYSILDEILNEKKDYIKFLYCILNLNIKLIITKKNNINDKNIILSKKFIYSKNKKLIENILKIYYKYFDKNERNIIKNDFNVIIYEEEYNKKGSDEYFRLKNRRDFLIPSFYDEKTIEFLNTVEIENIDVYKQNNLMFFKLLKKLRENIKTIDRLGVLIDGSIILNLYNIRKNNDLDLAVLHPNAKENREKLLNINELEFVDLYIDKILEWDGENKETLDKQTKEITENLIDDYFRIIFDPDYSIYFYGIKVIILDYDLKYRALRRYPKNVADLILIERKYKNIKIPKFKCLENNINVNNKIYNKNKFIKTVKFYLRKKGIFIENIENKINKMCI